VRIRRQGVRRMNDVQMGDGQGALG
jgi:hypothetical protein